MELGASYDQTRKIPGNIGLKQKVIKNLPISNTMGLTKSTYSV